MREEMLEQLMAADFAVAEMLLFLDTHPADSKGMAMLAEYKQKATALRASFVTQYGPLMAFESTGDGDWIENPWPWDVDQFQG